MSSAASDGGAAAAGDGTKGAAFLVVLGGNVVVFGRAVVLLLCIVVCLVVVVVVVIGVVGALVGAFVDVVTMKAWRLDDVVALVVCIGSGSLVFSTGLATLDVLEAINWADDETGRSMLDLSMLDLSMLDLSMPVLSMPGLSIMRPCCLDIWESSFQLLCLEEDPQEASPKWFESEPPGALAATVSPLLKPYWAVTLGWWSPPYVELL
jgi:hypothetical protein